MRKKYSSKTEDSAAAEEQVDAGVEALEEATEEETAKCPKTPLVKRAVYKTVYAVSFGAVFSSLLVKKLLVPKGGVVEAALHDGAVAAHHALEEHERFVAETVQETHEILAGEEPLTA